MVTIYLFLVSALLYFRPALVFDGGKVREFGTGRRGATVFPAVVVDHFAGDCVLTLIVHFWIQP